MNANLSFYAILESVIHFKILVIALRYLNTWKIEENLLG